jgi:hypothetical protein
VLCKPGRDAENVGSDAWSLHGPVVTCWAERADRGYFVIVGLQRLDSKITALLVEKLLAITCKRIENGDRPTAQTLKVLPLAEGQARAAVPCLRWGEYPIQAGVRSRASA